VPSDIWSSLLRPGGEEGRKEARKQGKQGKQGGWEGGRMYL